MPPIFGFINTNFEPSDPLMIGRMEGVAKYEMARKINSIDIQGGYLATVVVTDSPQLSKPDNLTVMGDYIVIADANLYKRKELINKLNNGVDLTTASDIMLIFQSYLKWNRGCLKYLYGDFAFVIFCLKTGEIFCARDHVGVRPFFYAMNQEVFVFGSELRYVLASFKNRPLLSREYLLDTLVTVKSAKERSPFENIFRLKPGHCLQIVEGRLRIFQYLDVNLENEIRFADENEYIDLFREKLVQAVNARCEGVTKPGSELSGGLDSSAVTGIITEFFSGKDIRPVCFSNVLPAHAELNIRDEMEYIICMRENKSFDWVGVDWMDNPIAEMLHHAIDIQGCFIQQNFSTFNSGIYSAAGKCRIQVLLSGFGGDELVSSYVGIPWNELINDQQWRVIADELFYNGLTLKTIMKTWLLFYRYIKSLVYHPKYRIGLFTNELLDKRFSRLPLMPEFAKSNNLRDRFGVKHRMPARDKIALRQFDRIMHEHLPQRMEYCYTAASQYGIENRYPLLDIDLIETYLAFPPWMKQHHGINRYLFRQAIQGYVPEEIRKREEKSGSTVPQHFQSLLNEKEQIMHVVESCSRLLDLKEIIDLSRFPQWYEQLTKRDKNDLNYLNTSAFYDYLMIMLYFRDYG